MHQRQSDPAATGLARLFASPATEDPSQEIMRTQVTSGNISIELTLVRLTRFGEGWSFVGSIPTSGVPVRLRWSVSDLNNSQSKPRLTFGIRDESGQRIPAPSMQHERGHVADFLIPLRYINQPLQLDISGVDMEFPASVFSIPK